MMIPLASVRLFKRRLKRAEMPAGCRCEIDRSSNMSSDLRISQIPAIVHCQLSVCSSQPRAKIDVRTYEEKITRNTLLGEMGHLPPLFPLLIQPCTISISMKAAVWRMRPRCEAD